MLGWLCHFDILHLKSWKHSPPGAASTTKTPGNLGADGME